MRFLTLSLIFIVLAGLIGCSNNPKEQKLKELSGSWHGTFTQKDVGSYPMTIEFSVFEGNKFRGRMIWPSKRFDSTITQYTGYLKQENLVWSDSSFIKKNSEYVINGRYVAEYDKDTLKGRYFNPGSDQQTGTFTLVKKQ